MNNARLNATQKPLRILLTAKHRVRGGGQEKNFIEVARNLQDRYSFSFLFAGGHVEQDMESIGKIYSFPGNARWLLAPLDLLYMAYVIRKERIDIVHAHHRYPAFLASLLRGIMGFRQLTTAHNVFPDKSRFSRWGDHIVAVSHGVENWLTGECDVDPARITVIHNGIEDPARYTPDELATTKASLNIDPGVPVLCTVGRLLPQKNYSCLIHALSRLQDRPWHLLIIGEGEQHNELHTLSSELGLDQRISFLGFRDDVPQLMQLSTLYVMSSQWEGLPYVLVEALANGLPAVATDVGGVSEAVLDGVTGLLVDAGDENALATCIGRLLDDAGECERMAAAARQHFEDHFHANAMLDALDGVYRTLSRPDG
jgi:glycosyltransferase involved in cell wall biosynthesis